MAAPKFDHVNATDVAGRDVVATLCGRRVSRLSIVFYANQATCPTCAAAALLREVATAARLEQGR